jgi:lantibiotic modifying enzyme
MTWRPILEGEDAARARAAIDDIAAALRGPVALPRGLEHSLSRGAAGIATFHAYRGHRRAAARWLGAAVEAVGRGGMNGSLYGGVTGIAWALDHLGAGAPEDVDRWLAGHLAQPAAPGDHDLMAGLGGHAVYALERGDRRCLEQVVERLGELAVADGDGLTWPAADGRVNLGLAHGVPAVIAVLAACGAWGLLDGAVAWLLAQPARDERSAWCYGDPGVAIALLQAARAAGEPAWERAALELALGVARRAPEDCGVEDAGFCHGAAGLGHLLNRLAQAMGDPELLAAARYWLRRALDLREPGTGVAGYTALRYDARARAYADPDPGLLMGAAGIGLALLAATRDAQPAWDRVLLASAVTVREASAVAA